jgi:hypothetical protein
MAVPVGDTIFICIFVWVALHTVWCAITELAGKTGLDLSTLSCPAKNFGQGLARKLGCRKIGRRS